jgi:hypothetical protein
MKMEIATIIGLVGQVAQMVEGGKRTITAIRTIIERDHPADLAAFDAAVAAAQKPWQQAAAAAAAEESGGAQ